MYCIRYICYMILMLVGDGFCKSIDEIVSSEDKIAGGVPTTTFERPFQVSIQTIQKEHFCGGSLISRQHVLTAAHCTPELLQSPENCQIMAGYELIKESSPRKQYRAIESTIVHEGYGGGDRSRNYTNDIAIIKVSKPFDLTDTVKLATLRLKPTKIGKICTVSGWGKILQNGTSNNKLLKTDVPMRDIQDCNHYNIEVTNTMLCGGTKNNGFCYGDSGGPLTCDNELTGIVSFGEFSCGNYTRPSIYTEVYHFKEWIDKHTV